MTTLYHRRHVVIAAMSIVSGLNPKHLFKIFDEIDQNAAAERGQSVDNALHAGRIASITLCTTAICLFILHYLKFETSFWVFLQILDGLFGYNPGELRRQWHASGFLQLLAYGWWGFWHLLCYVLIPILVIKYILRKQVGEFGIRCVGLRSHLHWYVLLCAPILGFVVIAGFRQDFLAQYPFYRLASRSWFDLLAWEIIYLSQFVCLEFFFRGFLLYGCKAAFGANAILVMGLPYLMIHFAKPWPEAGGAILFGLFLGMLALRSGSIWGGVLVHITIASSMDMVALLRSGGLPLRWWP
jgi:membrane protease YdiL (CAAX protease family)